MVVNAEYVHICATMCARYPSFFRHVDDGLCEQYWTSEGTHYCHLPQPSQPCEPLIIFICPDQ